jgi:OOP family OmpA-OmpF porin
VQGSPQAKEQADLIRLRRLLLGNDYQMVSAMRGNVERLAAFEEELKDPARQTGRVAAVLSEAMLLRENKDHGVSKALRPAIADAIKSSVRTDPRPVVEAVSPVIGPAIRRSVNEAIAAMLERLDKLLEHNFSWQALRWRIEALRTGRNYAEVVLLRTLVYRVDQVLLIHRETGLLLQHAEPAQGGVRDPDLIGGMLTAIRDFVNDTLAVTEESPVQTMQVGDYKVIVEQGRLAILAAIVRGNPPSEMARTLQEALQTIHLLHGDELECFDGDAAPLADTRSLLEACLTSEQRTATRRRPWLAPALIGLLVSGALAFWAVHSYQSRNLWTRALTALRSEPGILVTDAVRDGGVHRVQGLRDALARDPSQVVGEEAISGLRWEWDWRPFLSAEPNILLARAQQALQPPDTVELSLDGSLLRVSGEAQGTWVEAMRRAVPGIAGIAGYNDDALRSMDPSAGMQRVWDVALSALRTEPGIVVVDAALEDGTGLVQGLRDPLARDPQDVIGPEARSGLKWEWDWRPFLSVEDAFLLARSKQILRPPPRVALSLDGSILEVSGEAPAPWVETLRNTATVIPGITGYRDDTLRVIDPLAEQREALAGYRREIESTPLYFDINEVVLRPDQVQRLDTLASAMKALLPLAEALGLTPRYLVAGYADATGSLVDNRRLSFGRARGVIEGLVSRGIPEHLFFLSRVGSGVSNRPSETREERAHNRRVVVRLTLLEDNGETHSQ